MAASTMGLPRVEATAGADRIVDALERAGCVVIPRLLGSTALATLEREVRPWIEASPAGTGEFISPFALRTCGLIVHSPGYAALSVHPTIAAALQAVLGPHCDCYQLSASQAITLEPGAPPQPLHRDDVIYPLPHPRSYEASVTVAWALTDFTEENGATRVIPGSHRWDDGRKPSPDETVPATMAAGSVSMVLGSTYHGGGAHRGSGLRTGLFFNYALGWLRQEENQYLLCPPEVARSLPEAVRRLIGYALHKPYLGWFDHQDPHVVVEGYRIASRPPGELYEGALDDIPGMKSVGGGVEPARTEVPSNARPRPPASEG